MKVALGAPVGPDRAWILPSYFDCIRGQTVKPDYLCFVLTPQRFQGDTEAKEVRQLVVAEGKHYRQLSLLSPSLPSYNRAQRDKDAKDPNRARHFCKLRNHLRRLFMDTDADVFVSLDSDILMENPTTLERLLPTLESWDVACMLTSLHPVSPICYNAAFWRTNEPGSATRLWERADQNLVASARPPVKIDIPMAAFAIRRHAMGMVRYRFHEQGEDLGFADSLERHKFRVGWRTDVQVRHVWDPPFLEEAS